MIGKTQYKWAKKSKVEGAYIRFALLRYTKTRYGSIIGPFLLLKALLLLDNSSFANQEWLGDETRTRRCKDSIGG